MYILYFLHSFDAPYQLHACKSIKTTEAQFGVYHIRFLIIVIVIFIIIIIIIIGKSR